MIRKLFTLVLVASSTLGFTACQRQQALFQRAAAPSHSETVVQAPDQPTIVVTTVALPSEQVKDIKQIRQQLDEAIASNSGKLTSDKALAKRIGRVQKALSIAEQKAATAPATSAHKLTLVEKAFLKRVDAKIRNHVAPEKPMMEKNIKIGLILVLSGLLAQFIPFVNILGLIAIIVGLVFIIIGLSKL